MPFYGGGIAARVKDMQPKCPTQFHFGDKDAAIPLDDLQKIKDALQDSPLYVYDDSGHGFTCDDRDHSTPARRKGLLLGLSLDGRTRHLICNAGQLSYSKSTPFRWAFLSQK